MTTTQPLARVRRLSRLFSGLALGLAVLLIALDATLWLDRAAIERGAATLLPAGTPHELTATALIGGFVLSHLVLGLLLFALWQAHRLFSAFAAGMILVPETGDRLFRIGLAFLLVPAAQLVASGAVTMLLTWGHGRMVNLSIDPAHVMLGAGGLLIMTVGWVMAEAARIADDNAQII